MHVKIPDEWKKYADGTPFVMFDSGRREDRVVLMSSPSMMEVSELSSGVSTTCD